jgi:hypothetical protein
MVNKVKCQCCALALLFGTVVSGAVPLHSAAQEKPQVEVGVPSPPGVPPLPRVELKVPAAEEAKTAEDHRAVAARYQQESGRLRQEAARHAELAKWWASQAGGQSPAASYRYDQAEHCRRFNALLEQAAQAAQSLAQGHESMAQSLAEGEE